MSTLDKDTEHAIDDAVDEVVEEEVKQPEPGNELADEPVEDTTRTDPDTKSPPRDRKKKLIIAAVVSALLLAVVFGVPFLRYGLLGVFVHKPVDIKVLDDTNGKPVSGVTISLGSVNATTDKTGVAHFTDISVGDHYAKATKKYYTDWSGSFVVPIFGTLKNNTVKLKATGRTITVAVMHSITGKPVSDATVTIGDSSAISDNQGAATVILPVASMPTSGTVKADNYNGASFTIDAKASDDQTVSAKLVPVGRVSYLSNASGIINVMSANLDGSDAKVLVQGTGKEYSYDTMIMATKDWKYLMLSANREGKTRLYLINTADGSLTKIDNDDATYIMTGWIDDTFVYSVSRPRQAWQPGITAIKTYSADNKKLTTVKESDASGTSYYHYLAEYITSPALIYGRLIYGQYWSASNAQLIGKKSQIVSAQPNGVTSILKEFDAAQYTVGMPQAYAPNSAYVPLYSTAAGANVYYDVTNGKVTQTSLDDGAFSNAFKNSYQVSPQADKTAWSELRGGRDAVFTGDASGKSAKQLSPIGYKVYGWYGESYLLLAKNGSELYIYPADGSTKEPVKVTDYYRPNTQWMGMGYGAAS